MDLSSAESCADDTVPKLIDACLKGLLVLGTSKAVVSKVRRHLQLLGSVNETAERGATNLESLLRQHDLLIGSELGGFGNLFRSAIDNNEIFVGESIDFDGLEPALQSRLKPMREVAEDLFALEDVLLAFDLDADRLASCLVLDGISQWVTRDAVCEWISCQEHLENTLRLFNLSCHLDGLSVEFVQRELVALDIKEFALWLLVRILTGRIKLEPLERRLADTLLKKADLASLSTFEKIGFQR